MLKFFDKYVSLGLKPIAIYKNTKCPVDKGWNENWSIDRWRPYFETDRHNMGILLGDIIDVEGDTEEANNLLKELIGDSQCPKFQSVKSVHNLFLNPDPNLTRCVCGGIEFRGNSHQSVVPPSTHNDGQIYRWLPNSVFPPPPLPQRLFDFYQNRKLNRKKKLKLGILQTECKNCNNLFYIHERRLILEVKAFKQHNSFWMCHKCRKIDIRDLCRLLRNN